MIEVNLLAPKAKWFPLSSTDGMITVTFRYPGAVWSTFAHINLWGSSFCPTKAYYTLKKVKTVEMYKVN